MTQAQISMIESATFGMLPSMMTEGQRIRHLRKELGKTQVEFAEMIGGVTRGAIGNWERDQGIKRENLIRVSEITGASFEWLARGFGQAPSAATLRSQINGDAFDAEAPDERPTRRKVRVVGYVGAGSETHFYTLGEEDMDEVDAPDGSTEHTRAVQIRGTSLGTAFDRWYAFYDDVRHPVTNDLMGHLCIVRLADGRTLIKKVALAKVPGRYRLTSDAPPIENVEIEWAARVMMISPN